MADTLICRKDGAKPITLWTPADCGSMARRCDKSKRFRFVARTLHLDDALDSCRYNNMKPTAIHPPSRICSDNLPDGHPLKDIKVLWFSPVLDDENPNEHDWSGNVRFKIGTYLLALWWPNKYLVEMMSTHSHTATRILLTSKNYSNVLVPYDNRVNYGPWKVTPDGRHRALTNCRRYENQGYNRYGHHLQFMIEVTHLQRRQLMSHSTISFRNHVLTEDVNRQSICRKFKREGKACSYSYTADEAEYEFEVRRNFNLQRFRFA